MQNIKGILEMISWWILFNNEIEWLSVLQCVWLIEFPIVLVEDWDLFEKTIEYFYAHQMKSTADQHPLLMSEPVVIIPHDWNR